MSSERKNLLKPTWQIIYEIADSLGSPQFTLEDIIAFVNKNKLNIKKTTIRSHLIGMSPNHPSSVHQPFLREKHPIFTYLGGGNYSLNQDSFQIKEKITEDDVPIKDHSIGVDTSPIVSDVEELGDFYVLISSFEKELRYSIRTKLGKGIYKKLEKEMPHLITEWKKRKKTDQKWGIPPEKDLINYSLLTEYMEILRKYKNMFTSGNEELSMVLNQLKQFATFGRNPLMHCRTLTLQKYYTTISSVNYLKEWLK